MAYTPTTWATGDVITADKLNNMEQGIVNAKGTKYIPVDMDEDGAVYGENAYQQIQDALSNNVLPILELENSYYVFNNTVNETFVFVQLYFTNGRPLQVNMIAMSSTNYGVYNDYTIS